MGASPNSVRGSSKLRARSSSAGRGPDKGLRARYWAYLFENLQRAVDEIYHTYDSEGWETVRRNKPRSRNSPPKKMLAHQAPPSQAMGVKRSPSAPAISAPAPMSS
ncbi:hypothetical protein HPB52_010705 [Rhipicephalus sanguineus]|uniref:S phase cyclin A-associated protein in the endoplasmic reticulum N-terminal domain-containing protein n=1 Tax=Rhipicephalus sanguineus TaxID=34632 RepID=A0A9D4SZW6_RHISA|nr:hypothetical protein HPB52_010705 [Rhipicephalus sanguineus]